MATKVVKSIKQLQKKRKKPSKQVAMKREEEGPTLSLEKDKINNKDNNNKFRRGNNVGKEQKIMRAKWSNQRD